MYGAARPCHVMLCHVAYDEPVRPDARQDAQGRNKWLGQWMNAASQFLDRCCLKRKTPVSYSSRLSNDALLAAGCLWLLLAGAPGTQCSVGLYESTR